MREYLSATAWASVRTSMVLPRPGAPSSNTWPPASSAISTPSTTSPWPTMALEISPRTSCIFSARDSACWPSGLSPFCPSIRTDPVMNPSDSGELYASFQGLSVIAKPAPFYLKLNLAQTQNLFLSALGVLEIMLHIPAVARRNIFLLRSVRHRHSLGRCVANRQLCRARPGIHSHAGLLLEAIGFES